MTVPAVAQQIDEHIALELLSVLRGQLRHGHDRLGVFAIDMEDRCVDQLADVGAVPARPPILGQRGEADLVVHNDMDRAAGRIALKLREVEDFLHDALADDRRVAVDQHGRHTLTVGIAPQPLLGTASPLDDAVDRFEVARVARQGQVDHAPVVESTRARVATVVFHIAAAIGKALGPVLLELGEDLLERLADGIVQHIESTAMGHAQHDLFDAQVRERLDHVIEQWDQRLSPFETEPLLAGVTATQELLERL